MEFKKCFDGFIKITIPGIGVTWAKDLEDAEIAIAEALETHRLMINQFASVSEKKVYYSLVN
jgi:hypothetical protein